MAKIQTRRCISMRKETHAKLKAYSVECGTSMSQIADGWINDHIDAVERSKKRASLAANRTVAQLAMTMPKRRAEWELAKSSERYHAHPSHPSDCEVYREHYGKRCPCEDWTGEPGPCNWHGDETTCERCP